MRTRKRQDPELAAAREEAFRARMEAARQDSVALRQRVLDEVLADVDRKQNARKKQLAQTWPCSGHFNIQETSKEMMTDFAVLCNCFSWRNLDRTKRKRPPEGDRNQNHQHQPEPPRTGWIF